MKEIHVSVIEDTVAQLAIDACCKLPHPVLTEFKNGIHNEPLPLGSCILQHLVNNAELAEREMMPLCQDTGLAVIFTEIGQDVVITGGDFEEAINKGVRKGYISGYLRKSVVAEPLFERKNTGDNTPAIIHTRLVPGDTLMIRFGVKGAGAENKSKLKMLIPADGIDGVKRFVLETVMEGGASACPPLVVGIGIGGDLEIAAICAKKAALRDIDTHNKDPQYAALEDELLQEINKMGLGPLGFGGRMTACKVNIEFFATHIASLPVAVNLNCHSARHTEVWL